MKHIAILGSTGSIGQSTLEVIRHFPKRFKVAALSAHTNISALYKQIEEFKPDAVCVVDINAGLKLKSMLAPRKIKFFLRAHGLIEMVGAKRIDTVVLGISGSAALIPLLGSIESGKDIALANKEALVMAGDIIMRKVNKQKINLLPIDSEQSAIWQCLNGQDRNKLKNIYLTASGGPFRDLNLRQLKNISVVQALRHPRWKMGRKISIDSATLMNKGLEVIETMHLFNMGQEKIKILIHPEAIIHSMVEFIDGVILAQMSMTDMRIPIQYSLSYPQRLSNGKACVDFLKLKSFTFADPDFKKFPCLALAYQAAREGGTAPCALNAANEVSVASFLAKRINFLQIPYVIEKVLGRHRNIARPDLGDVLGADFWAKEEAARIISGLD